MIKTINPYTGEHLQEFSEFSSSAIDQAVERAHNGFRTWRETSFDHRSDLMQRLADELVKNKEAYARDISLEMGKPINQARAEIEKCSWVCRYYAENAEGHLAQERISTDASDSYVRYEPLGVILAVMPWNFPFWQVFRFAAPALMAGNIALLKHASNSMKTGENIQKAFHRAGFPRACFQNLIISSKKVEGIIRDPRVKAVTLTGSTPAGSAVASVAGEVIKKSVLELGGSNALVVFKDADLEATLSSCIMARYQNTGQSCIAGKRLLVEQSIAEDFTREYIRRVQALKSGDPMKEDTFIGVLAREDLARGLEQQVQESLEKGAVLLTGGKREKAYFQPTVLGKVTPGMPVFDQETFGPVIGVTTFEQENEAVALVNRSKFGLGVSVYTQDMERAKRLIPQFDEGSVFINDFVKSDPRLPFGGTKESGYGRELSRDGIREFVNIKTVYFN